MLGLQRIRWTAGQYANVDGIPFEMPVASRNSPLMFACFGIDIDAAKSLMPGRELHPLRIWNRGVLAVEVINYTETPIGKYVELCIGILCTRGKKPGPRLLPALLMSSFGTGQYIYDLPVSSEISTKGGLGIWGMPKRQANLDYQIGDEWVSSQYDLDGQMVMRLDVKRPAHTWLPVGFRGVGYGAFRGLLSKSYVHLHGQAGFTLGSGGARIALGSHPRAKALEPLRISAEPLISGFLPSTRGHLDDHVETWFLTHREPPPVAAEGLREVVGLGLSQDWLKPPNRLYGDELIRARYGAVTAKEPATRRPVRSDNRVNAGANGL
jgi:hypothetical protein